MEAINYIAGEKNMMLTEDAQIVQGVSGNGCYLPAGTGKIALKGDRNELSVSLWRQWDGVVEQDAERGVFSFTNIAVFFDNKTDLLTVIINGFKAITDIKDEQNRRTGVLRLQKTAALSSTRMQKKYTASLQEISR